MNQRPSFEKHHVQDTGNGFWYVHTPNGKVKITEKDLLADVETLSPMRAGVVKRLYELEMVIPKEAE